MAGQSTFPALLDTDTNLYRVVDVDPVIPAHHNNHTDAIESLEAAIGVFDDGTGANATPVYNGGVAHFVGYPSSAYPNIQHPFDPVSAEAIIGSDSNSLALWTLGAGVTASWVNPRGVLRLTYPSTNPFNIASVPLPVQSDYWVRISLQGDGATDTGLGIGFSILGNGTDLDGVAAFSLGSGNMNIRQCLNGVRPGSGTSAALLPFQTSFYLHTNVSVLEFYSSIYGGPFHTPVFTTASRGLPTAFFLRTVAANSGSCLIWIDQINIGYAPPPLYQA